MKQIITLAALLSLQIFSFRQAHPIQDNNNSYQDAQLKYSRAIKQGIDSLIIQVWDENASQWKIAFKEVFTYDANGNMTQSIPYWDEGSGQLEAGWKSEYTYDANGNKTQYLSSKWDESTSQWVQSDNEEYTYDASGNMIQSNRYGWDESTDKWFDSEKSEFIHDAHGNMTQSVESYWDGFSNEWVTQYKHEYAHNANGDRTQTSGYRWDGSTSDWIPIDKIEYTFDAHDNITQSLYYCWDEGTSKYVECWKEEYSHDEKGNIIQNLQYEWDEGTDYLFGKYEYTYDTSYARSELILPYFNDDISIIEAMDILELFNHKMNGFLGSAWDEASEDWIPNLRGDYFYSEQNVSAVNETEEEISRIYPNPCSDYIAFSFSENFHQITLKLFDLQGRKLMTRAIKNHEIIRLEGLENGIYVYELITGDGKIQSGRLIKL